MPMGAYRANPAAGLSRDPRPFIAAAAERANAAARLVPKHSERQPMVRSLLRDGPRDPSWLCCAGVCPGSRARGALGVGAQGVQGAQGGAVWGVRVGGPGVRGAPRRAVHTRFGLNHSRPPDVSRPGIKPRRAVILLVGL